MWWGVAGIAAVVVLLFLTARKARRDALPSVEVMKALQETVRGLQKTAFANLQSARPDGGAKESSMTALREQTGHAEDRVRLVYSLDKEDEGYMHIVSTQLTKPAPERYHYACLATIWLVLNQQLEKAGIDSKDVRYHFDKSNLGTLFIYMQLTPEQQEALLHSLGTEEANEQPSVEPAPG